jgi:hypothetical protein
VTVTDWATYCRPELIGTGISLGGLSPHRVYKSAACEISLIIFFNHLFRNRYYPQCGKIPCAVENTLGAFDP